MSCPLVTVVMSVHNAASTLELALRSILWQTFTDWECLIVDDGSTDQTRRILGQVSDTRIRVICGEGWQKGLPTRLNQCIELGQGQYVARMDADDIAYPERLERQVRYLEAHPDIDLLGHGAVLFKGDGQVVGIHPIASGHEEICRRPWWGFPLPHPTWMGKRSWFVRYRYDEAMTKGQDQALLLGSYRSSRFAALPDILLGYRMERISAKKSWQGRLNYCRQLLRGVHDTSSALIAMRGMLVHSLAVSRDALLYVTKELNQRSRQSFQEAADGESHQWYDLWDRIQSETSLAAGPAAPHHR